jgi:nitrite reductase/ring-hydroxylating ferredoxin subunit
LLNIPGDNAGSALPSGRGRLHRVSTMAGFHEQARTDAFIRVGTLEELQAKGMMVVQGTQCPLLVIHDRGGIFALDNRCPHLGFPLHRGSVEDGLLTCHWHHARLELASGCTFDLWADDIPTAAAELREGVVWVAPETRFTDGDAHWRNRLREGLEHDIGLVIAKAILGLMREGADPGTLVRETVLFGTRNRDGWGIGLTILTALANLLPLLPPEQVYLALYQGIRRVARDCDGQAARRDRHPLGAGQPLPVRRWLRHWTRVRHRDGAERTLLTAIADGVAPADLADMLLIAVTDRYYADGGHALDFINKAFECLDVIGWEYAATILPTVISGLVSARGGEESNAWRHLVDLVALCEDTLAELPACLAAGASKRGQWQAHADLADALLGDDPAALLAALKTALAAGAEPRDLSRALCHAAALRVVRFGTSNEFSDWDEAHHAFTYCHALHRLIGRAGSGRGADRVGPELLRGIFHGAMAVYLNRFLNIPPARLPDGAAGTRDHLPTDAEELRAAFLAALDRQNQVTAAARIAARYLALGHPAGLLIEAFAQAVLREDADFHTYQMLEAGIRTYQGWGDCREGHTVLLAMARYLAAHAPTRRAQLQTAQVARRLSRGQEIHSGEAANE